MEKKNNFIKILTLLTAGLISYSLILNHDSKNLEFSNDEISKETLLESEEEETWKEHPVDPEKNFLETGFISDFDLDSIDKIQSELDFKLLEEKVVIMTKDEDYIWAKKYDSDRGVHLLLNSDDLGENWMEIHTFPRAIEGLHITENGNILASISRDRWSENADTELLLSKDGGKNFKHVLDIKSGAAINWNLTSNSRGDVYASEYGFKNLPDNARRIYKSEDFGENWRIVYEPEAFEGYHNHVIHIDSLDQDTVYQSFGDNIKGVLKSTDAGENWEQILEGIHPTGVLDLGDSLLWSLDGYPKSGVVKHDKESNQLEYSFQAPEPYGGSIYDIVATEDGDIYIGLISYNYHSWPASIFRSSDEGDTWELVLSWPKLEENSPVSFSQFIFKDGFGFMKVELPVYDEDGEIKNFVGSVKFSLE